MYAVEAEKLQNACVAEYEAEKSQNACVAEQFTGLARQQENAALMAHR